MLNASHEHEWTGFGLSVDSLDYYPPQRWGTWTPCSSSYALRRKSRNIKVCQNEPFQGVGCLVNSRYIQGQLQGRAQRMDGAEQKLSLANALCSKPQVGHSYGDDLVALLKDCAKQKDLLRGIRLHDEIVERQLPLDSVSFGSALINMYVKCGELGKAQDVFDKLQVRNEVLWTPLIMGYAQYGLGEKALKCFEQMQQEGFSPNAINFVCALKACGSIKALGIGQDIHEQIAKAKLLERDIVIGNALVDMYIKCGQLGKAQKVFDELPIKNVISWTTLISGYTQHGHSDKALNCYEQMQSTGFSPNAVTFTCILKAAGDTRDLDRGQQVYAKIVKDGLHENDFVVATALVDMYAKCGIFSKAQGVFDEITVRNVVSWTALISGYAQHEFGEEALLCFEGMQNEGIAPDGTSFACALKACGSIGMAHKGQALHDSIIRNGSLEKDLVVGTALIHMYANCGMLAEAQDIFDKLHVCDVVLWNALLEGYAQIGKENIVFTLFDQMLEEGKEPDVVTFTIMLNTCSHSGLLDKGCSYFEMSSNGYGAPIFEHYTCVVDFFGRSGQLESAMAMVEGLPFLADFTLWQTVLSACQRSANTILGIWVSGHGMRCNERNAAVYVSFEQSLVFLDML